MNNEMKKNPVIWLQANGLVINQDKTHYMVFHKAKIIIKSNKINIRDNKISTSIHYTIFRPHIK